MAIDPQAREHRLVRAIVRRRWPEVRVLARRAPLDAQRFVDACRECDVHPWVHALLERQEGLPWIGPQATTRLGELREKVRQDNLLLLARAERAFHSLARAGVVPVALKGLDALHRLYDRFDERTIDDIDLLVARHQLPRALQALCGAGWTPPAEPRCTHYIRSSHHLPLRGPGPIPVDLELHWNLAQEGRFRIDADSVLRRVRPLEIAGCPVLRLDDHDAAAHLLVHHLSHYFDRRLKWLVDLQLLRTRPGFDWDAVAERVRTWGANAAAAAALRHLHKLDPETIPREVLSLLPLAAWRRLATWPLRSSHPLELFRGTRRRRVQLFLAAVLLERPSELPRWLLHRLRRDRRRSTHPLDPDLEGTGVARRGRRATEASSSSGWNAVDGNPLE